MNVPDTSVHIILKFDRELSGDFFFFFLQKLNSVKVPLIIDELDSFGKIVHKNAHLNFCWS